MIPRIIRVKNFLSYGPNPQEIDFSNHQFICLSGKNGHGKSALLDAITWVLWGQARKMNGVARADEHLVHLGQDYMVVSFDFECNNIIYRATREYSKIKGKKTLTELQFGVLDQESGNFITKTGKTSRETQETITKTLGLTFDGCVNSIFLRQGQSHEFSKKSPQERKEVLASILGLAHLEEYRDKVLTLVRELSHEKLRTEEKIEELQKTIKDLGILDDQLVATKNKQAELIAKIKTTRDQLQQTIAIQKQYQDTYSQLQLLIQEFELTKQNTTQQKNTYQRSLQEWKSLRKELRDKINIAQPRRAENTLVEEIQLIQAKKSQSLLLQQQNIRIQQELNDLEQKHQLELINGLQEHNEQIQKTTTQLHILSHRYNHIVDKQITLETELNSYKKEESAQPIINVQAKLEETEKRLTHSKNSIDSANQEIKRIIQKSSKEQQILSLLQHTTAHCPTCKQVLPNEQKELLNKEYFLQVAKLEHQLKRQQSRLATAQKMAMRYQKQEITLKKTLQEQEQQIKYQTLFEEKTILHGKIIDEQSALSCEIEEIKKQLALQNKQKDSAFTTLKEKYQFNGQRIKLSDQQHQITAAEKKIHEELRLQDEAALEKELQDVRSWASIRERIASKKEEKRRTARALHEAIITYKGSAKHMPLLLNKIETARKQIPPNDPAHMTLLQKQIEELTHEYIESTGQIKLLQNQQVMLAKARNELQHVYAKKQALNIDLEEYQMLSTALGKNGLQALMIENILPEIELEANAILRRLSDNNTQVLFESIKDLKNGNSRETLDIHISDNMGIRPYELFSGGEAFRIDFALRIALSKLLAKRSGTPLQTLIIDEGFGSQDESGLEKILEALHRIQNDFEKIIVVSHLSEMKNQFPANFIIEKTASGSRVTIAEQW